MTRRPTGSFPRHSSAGVAVIQDSIASVIAGWQATRPELDVEPIAITARLARLHAILGPRLEGVFARFGLRGADFAVIATLVRLGEKHVSQRRLASELGLSAGSVSVRIDRLVKQGLVQRHPDPDDGRGALLSLTEPAKKLFEAAAPEHLANAGELLAGLTEQEREQLGRLLGKLLYTLEDAAPGDRLTPDLGLVVDSAPVALAERRAVGLPPVPGLLVRHVDPGGPAAQSGIRPGDLLTTADRCPLRSRHDLQLALDRPRARRRPLALGITRGAKAMQLQLTPPSR